MKIYEKPRVILPQNVKSFLAKSWIRRAAAQGYIYICPVCGNREKTVSKYCRNCGTKLSFKEKEKHE